MMQVETDHHSGRVKEKNISKIVRVFAAVLCLSQTGTGPGFKRFPGALQACHLQAM